MTGQSPKGWAAAKRIGRTPIAECRCGRYNEIMAMKCIHCQGIMKRGKAPIHIDRNGCHITIDNVPAWICEQCGEPLFEEREVEAIQDIGKAVDETSQFLWWSA